MKKRLFFLIGCFILLIITASNLTSQSARDIMIVNDDGDSEKRSERLAIVVGINKYSYFNNLKYAVPDARAIKETLESKGNFEVRYYVDDSPKSPDKSNIMQALRDAEDDVKQGFVKTLVVYFAGHGVEINGNHYLITASTYPKDLPETAISLNEVISILNEAKKKSKVMLFLDACRTDPTHRGSSDSRIWKSDINSHGLAILKSTAEGQYSYEMPDLGHGVYTYYLNKGLEGEADSDGNGFVSYDELRKYVRDSMYEWSDNNPNGLSQSPRSCTYERYGKFFITHIDGNNNNNNDNNDNNGLASNNDDNDNNGIANNNDDNNNNYIVDDNNDNNNNDSKNYSHSEFGIGFKFVPVGLSITDSSVIYPLVVSPEIYFDIFFVDWFGIGIEIDLGGLYRHYTSTSEDKEIYVGNYEFFCSPYFRSIFDFDVGGDTRIPILIKLGMIYPDMSFSVEFSTGVKIKGEDCYVIFLATLGYPQLFGLEMVISFPF